MYSIVFLLFFINVWAVKECDRRARSRVDGVSVGRVKLQTFSLNVYCAFLVQPKAALFSCQANRLCPSVSASGSGFSCYEQRAELS